MERLPEGCAVVHSVVFDRSEGNRAYAVPISGTMGARDIVQTVNAYARGVSPAWRYTGAEEVLYVVAGTGTCWIDGCRYPIEPATGIYLPPENVCCIENGGEEALRIIGVCCPEEIPSLVPPSKVPAQTSRPGPSRTVREAEQPSIPTGDRSFKLLVSGDFGCRRVTQFVGIIPPGRAPMHDHAYEEAIYILEGEGRIWTEQGSAKFESGTSIYLPRGVRHSLENTGSGAVRLLGVFHPSGSPAARSEEGSGR